jgi:hypothetical protein
MPNCSFATAAVSGVASVPEGNLSLCSPTGTTGGPQLHSEESALAAAAAAGASLCRSSAECGGSAGLAQCDMASSSALVNCTCDTTTGAEECELLGMCQPTPCAVCSRCISVLSAHAAAHLNNTNATAVASAVSTACMSETLGDSNACVQVAGVVAASQAGNLGKRPALLCMALGVCQEARVGSGCLLRLGPNGTAPTLPLEQISRCSPTGAPGQRLPGISASVQLPTGRCSNSSDCSNNQRCSMAAPGRMCACDEATGRDTCLTYGACVDTACATCSACVRDVTSFAINNDGLQPTALAQAWSVYCSVTLRRLPTACSRAAAAVTASSTGNVGRRAGALCSLLGGAPHSVKLATCMSSRISTQPMHHA